ncbi:OmpP1/FadL family transporter [Adhaeribacter terreus]|uniref:OmpP1/FadL family transporter n=1 Tax=Adhaeribacter terreus TaxID=529703 RepID=A0ABW0EH56_9BACT
MKKILLAVYLFSTTMLAQAGGFQVNTQGQKALGMGGAFSAYNKDASAAFYNPGALAMLDSGRYISIGSTFLMPKTTFLSTNTATTFEMESQPFFPSYLYAAIPVSERFTAGLSVNSPYGLGTKWDDNWEGRSVSQEVNLKTFYVQPTLSYRITDNFSAGAGFVYAYGDVLVRRQVGEINSNAKLTGSASGFGFNAGVFGKIQDELSFGITYRSNVKFDLDNGKASFTNVPASLSSQFPAQNFKSTLELPSTLSVGFTNRINQKVLVAFEFNLTGWSSYDSLNFNFENASTPDSKAGSKYEDAMAFRVGAEYTHNDNLTFRGGLFYDETPVRDEYISPELPDGSRIGLTAGLSYKLSERFELDAAYLFEKVAERNSVADFTKTDVSNVAGKYRTLVNGVGLGLNYKF